jgi:hypothetical protein
LPTVAIRSLQYQPVGPQGEQWAAQIALGVSTDYVIGLQNAVTTENRPIPIKFAVIDNIAGSTAVTVIMGNLTFAVPPFTREVLTLPDQLQNLGVNVGTGGGVTVTVSDGRPINDQTNFLSIQQTAAATLVYQFVNYSVNASQASTDLNKTILFTPNIANMAYQLLLAATAGNGWISFIYNQGTKTVALTPTAPNLLNGSAAAIVLNPGDAGILQSDGASWYYMDIATLSAIITTFSNLANAQGFLANNGAGVLAWVAGNLLAFSNLANAAGALKNDGAGGLSWGSSGKRCQIISATGAGNWVVPAGVTSVRYFLVGGGGGGSDSASGTNQGSGQVICSEFTGLTPGSSLAYNIGTGGTASNTTGGSPGNNSTFNGDTALGGSTIIDGSSAFDGYGMGALYNAIDNPPAALLRCIPNTSNGTSDVGVAKSRPRGVASTAPVAFNTGDYLPGAKGSKEVATGSDASGGVGGALILIY